MRTSINQITKIVQQAPLAAASGSPPDESLDRERIGCFPRLGRWKGGHDEKPSWLYLDER
jgi:hypothetical protein